MKASGFNLLSDEWEAPSADKHPSFGEICGNLACITLSLEKMLTLDKAKAKALVEFWDKAITASFTLLNQGYVKA